MRIKRKEASLVSEEAGTFMFGGVEEHPQQRERPLRFGALHLPSEDEAPVLPLQDVTTGETEIPLCNVKKRKRIQSDLVAVVATALIISAIGLLAVRHNHRLYENQTILTIRKGSGSDLLLPDGTKVWLGAGSRLSYSREFGNAGREVALEGTAVFDVATDDARSFIVHTRGGDVEGPGAAFSVRAYKNEPAVHAILQRGRAVVHLKDGSGKKVLLEPNKAISVPDAHGSQVEINSGKSR